MPTATKKPETRAEVAPLSRRAQRYQHRRAHTRNTVIAVAGAVLAMVVALVVVVSRGSGTTETTTPFEGSTLDLVLGDYSISGDLTAPAGHVRIAAFNAGGLVHNVGIRGGPISGDMQHGNGFTIDVGVLAPGTYQLYCDIVGHVDKGMVADLVVT